MVLEKHVTYYIYVINIIVFKLKYNKKYEYDVNQYSMHYGIE